MTPAQTGAAADATGRFFSRSAGTGRRRHGRGAAPVLDSRFSGGAGAGEKATFSLTYGKARREKFGHSHRRKVVSASLWEVILVCLCIMRRRCRRRRVNGECTQTGNSFYTIIEIDGKGKSQSERARRRGRADGVSRLFIFAAAYCIGRSQGERLSDTGH